MMLVHLAASCSFAFFFISSPFLFARCLREHMDERPAKRPGFEKPTCGDSRIYPRLLKQPHIRLLHSVPGAHADPRTSRCWDLRDDPPTFASAVLPQKNTVYEHGLPSIARDGHSRHHSGHVMARGLLSRLSSRLLSCGTRQSWPYEEGSCPSLCCDTRMCERKTPVGYGAQAGMHSQGEKGAHAKRHDRLSCLCQADHEFPLVGALHAVLPDA